MDTTRLVEVAPHYATMLLLVFLVLALLRAAVGEVGFWIELVVVIVVASAYRPLVTRLGIGPSGWT
jgi:hypothetical protein